MVEANIQKIKNYILSGAKADNDMSYGMELEHFIVDAKNIAVGYSSKKTNNIGIKDILYKIADHDDNKIYSENCLIGLVNNRRTISLEPAAQIEISISPQKKISDIEKIYKEFQNSLEPVLQGCGYSCVTLGYQPVSRAAALELIPKSRYRYMNDYFKGSGKYGINMMRATASTQISIDFKDENDCLLKFNTAAILTPLLALLTDNSPVFEGRPYSRHLLRQTIWSDTDKDRCGEWMLESLDEYISYIYSKPPIFIIDKNGASIYTKKATISEIYADKSLEEWEIEHILSMFFPDVRLKRYIELRAADSLPIELALAYTTFVKSIFKSTAVLKEIAHRFKAVKSADIKTAKLNIANHGLEASIYESKAGDILKYLLELSKSECDKDELDYLSRLYEKVFSDGRLYSIRG